MYGQRIISGFVPQEAVTRLSGISLSSKGL